VEGDFDGSFAGHDVDWFHITGTSCMTHPLIEADIEQSEGSEICMFVACEGGLVGCGPWTTTDYSGGVRACCGPVRTGFDIGTCTEAPTTFAIRVTGGEEGACLPYRLAWEWFPGGS